MQIEFLEPARAEYDAAIAYYNEQKIGLGFDFEEEVKKCIQGIAEFPEAWSSLSARTRRCRTRRFPYGVIYQLRGTTILIVAVMHLHREPESWRDRLVDD